MAKIPTRSNWFFKDGEVTPELQLSSLTNLEMGLMFDRTLRMFEYEGLPDGITYKDMERFTQMQGKQFFIKYEGRHYIIPGAFKDEGLTWNGEAKHAILVNVALPNLKHEYEIGKDAILYPNDSYYLGLYDLFRSRAIQIASTDISILFATINTRFKNVLVADDDDTKAALDLMMDGVINGKHPRAIAGSGLYEEASHGVNAVPYVPNSSNSDIKDLIELKQYLKASWYMELGIDANYNMKREAINENEAHMNDEALLPLIDDMMECRKRAIELINSTFNLNISIKFSSAWLKLKTEIEQQEEITEKEIEGLSNDKSIEEGSDDKPKNKDGEEDEA